ncbi:cytochrome b N-terminal domain-containing protein [Tundrisphaera lichenicola]|uniref:cytochrome b N-terminal domain-containing protein n=1 Tax=Tundrisphaera lichenicola TaxID=2029860 RepID=UPI003EB6D99E
MRNSIADWLDERTGYREAFRSVFDRPVPGGPGWGQVLGFTLAATLVVQLVTGLLLMTTYTPSANSAWGSVYFITYRMDLGWFIRGLHRFGSFGSVIVGGLLLLRLVLRGSYRAPREMNWWLAVGVFLLILVLGVTGNILPWDQRGYWAAVVEMTIAGGAPVVGPMVKKVVVGGSAFGNQTLTRIYGLHVAVLPGILAGLLWGYFALFRRHGFDGKDRPEKASPFWPEQALYHVVAAFVVLGLLIGLTLANHGYSLDAPANPSSGDYPARPEWYFLPLNQLMKVFHGQEMIATMVIPGIIVSVLMAMPFLDKILPRRLAHVGSCFFILTVAACSAYLTYQGLAHSDEFRKARAEADTEAERAIQLASLEGIPPEGSSYVLGRDPLTRGGELFGKKCQSCHNLGDRKAEEQSAADLKGFGSFAWIRGLLEKPDSDAYFGKVPLAGGMQEWKEGSSMTAKELDDVAAFVADFAKVSPDLTPDEWAATPEVKDHPGRAAFQKECAECHTMGDPSAQSKKLQPAPDLFGWGSDRWTARMIKHPANLSFYGYLEGDQPMPGFVGQVTDADLTTLVRYLKGQYVPTGGSTGTGPEAVVHLPSGGLRSAEIVTPASP